MIKISCSHPNESTLRLGLPETIRLFAKLTHNEVFIASPVAITFEPGTLMSHVVLTCHAPCHETCHEVDSRNECQTSAKISRWCLLWISSTLSRGESEEGDYIVPAVFSKCSQIKTGLYLASETFTIHFIV